MFKNVKIGKYELGLVFRRGDLLRVLHPGSHWVIGLPGRDRIEVIDTLDTEFRHRSFDSLVLEPTFREHLVVVDLADDERAVVWKDGRLFRILGSGRHAFHRKPAKIDVETFNVNDVKFEHAKLQAIVRSADASDHLFVLHVESTERALVFRNGEPIDEVGAGVHAYWSGAGAIAWSPVDLREQVADVAGQEIMTSDKVTLRINLVVAYRVTDPVKAATVTSDYAQALYREAQLALRAAIGGRKLDELLARKSAIGDEVKEAVTARAAEFGVVVRSVGLRDVILPGDMKTILNQVIEAQKQAEANVIKRREETAAWRSEANTAKLLAENPILARMKELEALREILAGTKASFVFGSGDLAEQVRSLTAADGGAT